MEDKFNERTRHRGQAGFTLIELLVVIAILAILGGVAVFAVGSLTDQAEDSACGIESRTVKTAVQAFKADNGGTYPATLAALVPDWLESAPEAGRWNYDAATGAVTATPGGPCV
jgi:general secretion pathway protein G